MGFLGNFVNMLVGGFADYFLGKFSNGLAKGFSDDRCRSY